MSKLSTGLPLKLYKGKSHKQGGINVNALGNKVKGNVNAVAEVEGGEYNYRYNPNNPKDNYILSKKLGIAAIVKKASSFDKLDRISTNTRNNLLNKSLKLNEVLKLQQEQQPQMQLSGMLKKYSNGDLLKGSQSIIDSMVANSKPNDLTQATKNNEVKLGNNLTPLNNLTELPKMPEFKPATNSEAANTGLTTNTKVSRTSEPTINKKGLKDIISGLSNIASELGPIGKVVGAGIQLAPYAVDLGKAMFDKTSVQDLQTQGSAMRLPNTKYAKNGGKLDITPLPQFDPGGIIPKTSQQDSVRNYFYNTVNFEKRKGSKEGKGLSNAGNPRLPLNVKSSDAVDWMMNNIYNNPLMKNYSTAREQADAGDFLYNSGKDMRVYMLDQYLKNYKKQPQGLEGRSTYNVKMDQWTPELRNKFETEWSKYKNEINNLSQQQRVELNKKGRDFYYRNIENKADGSPNSAYGLTWKYRPNLNDNYVDISQKNIPVVKKQEPIVETKKTNPLVIKQQPTIVENKPNVQTAVKPDSSTNVNNSTIKGLNPFEKVEVKEQKAKPSTVVTGRLPGGQVDINNPFNSNNPTTRYGTLSNGTIEGNPFDSRIKGNPFIKQSPLVLKSSIDKKNVPVVDINNPFNSIRDLKDPFNLNKDIIPVVKTEEPVETKTNNSTVKTKKSIGTNNTGNNNIPATTVTPTITPTTTNTTVSTNMLPSKGLMLPGATNIVQSAKDRFDKDNMEREKEYETLVGNALKKFNVKEQTPITKETSESDKLFKAGQNKQKLAEALMYGMATIPSERIKTITPDFGRGDAALSNMGLSTEPIRQEIMQGANKVLELNRSQVGTAGQLQSRGQSIMSNVGSQLAQSQLQQQQYLNQLRSSLAQREDTKASVLAQGELTAREAKSAERAAKLDQLNNAISQTSAIGAGNMEQASKMSTIENENERFKRQQDFIRSLSNQGLSFKVDENGNIIFDNKTNSSNIQTPNLATTNTSSSNTSTSPTTTENTHIIKKGDSLYRIAVNNKLTLNDLLKLNPGLKTTSVIQPGQTIKIK